MVRGMLAGLAGIVLLCGTAQAHAQSHPQSPDQTADWSRAGGGLFPRETIDEAESEEGGQDSGPTPDGPYADLIRAAAQRHGLDVRLLEALVQVESAGRADAVSSAGAAGLTQLMPGTAADLGVKDRFDPAENLMGGAAYLAAQIRRFQDLRLALAAFNAGPGRVERAGGVPRIAETEAYVVSVLDCFLARVAGRLVRSRADCRPGRAS